MAPGWGARPPRPDGSKITRGTCVPRTPRPRPRRPQRPLELYVDRLGVASHHRHPRRGGGDAQLGQAEDLAALDADLVLLVGVAVLLDGPVPGEDVEGDGLSEDLLRLRLALRP